MPIYVDVSAAVHRRAGLGRYAESMIRALVEQDPHRWGLFYNKGGDYHPLIGLEHLPTRTVSAGNRPWRMAVLIRQALGIGFDRLLPDGQLFHAMEHLLPPFHHIPTVLTVHDLIYHLFPEHHKPLNYHYLNRAMPLYCHRADAIIAISECTRRDLIEQYHIDPAKITVVYEAAASHFRPSPPGRVDRVRARYALPNRFLIHVGTLEPRKNLVRLLDAMAALREAQIKVNLVLVGARGWLYEGFFRRLEKLAMEDTVKVLGYLPDEDLPALYSAATACVLPSVYEGFGLPILEAMACGTPVVCSRAASLPELGGGAAGYFNPHNTDDMASVLREVWEDESLREEMSASGLTQSLRFSWTKAAEETIAVYEQTLEMKSR